MLAKVGREIGPHLRRGQLVLSVLAGATTAALIGILGHDQVVRSMPNTPARLGKGMTVWYATPETTEAQRAQAAALLGALGHELEVDDEKMVAMATAVSGTGPTYVFLVMEALIDAAVHLGFPRHIAHDLVIETLEGSTLFAKQSGMHPAELRNMVTSPGGTSAAALHELESGRLRTVLSEAVWAAYRRTVELGDQLEASVGPRGRAPERRLTDDARRGREPRTRRTRSTCGAHRCRRSAAGTCALRSATCGPTKRPCGIGCRRTWAGLDDAAWHLPGAAPSDAGGPAWSLAEHVGHIADWQELAIDYTRRAIETGVWPSDSDYDDGDFDTFNERRREPWASMPRDEILGRLEAARPRLLEVAQRLSPETIRERRRLGWVYRGAPRPLPRPPRGHRAVDRRLRRPGAASLMPTAPITPSPNLTIEAIVAVDAPREFRLHPRDRVVAFTAEAAGARQLFTLALRGGYPAQLTASEKPVSDPQWSPDGRRLAFVRDDEIWVIEADGSRLTRVVGKPGAGRDPRWSPDGHRLAFLSRRRGWTQIWLIDAPVPRRGRPATEPKPPRPTALTETGIDVDAFEWAPDGDAHRGHGPARPGHRGDRPDRPRRRRHRDDARAWPASGASMSRRAGCPTVRSSSCRTPTAGSRSSG